MTEMQGLGHDGDLDVDSWYSYNDDAASMELGLILDTALLLSSRELKLSHKAKLRRVVGSTRDMSRG